MKNTEGLWIRDGGCGMRGVGRVATHKRRSLCLPTAGHAIHTDRNVCAPVRDVCAPTSLATGHWPLASPAPRPKPPAPSEAASR